MDNMIESVAAAPFKRLRYDAVVLDQVMKQREGNRSVTTAYNTR